MKKLLVLIILFVSLISSIDLVAQTGGRKKEHRNQRRSGSLFKRNKSKGNADKFSRGQRKGFFARVFKKDRPSWVQHRAENSRGVRRGNRHLFSRFRTKGKVQNESILTRQNQDRAKRRVRGNKVFHKSKYRG